MTPSRARKARLGAVCGAIAWMHAFAPHAVADDVLQLTWRAPAECPSAAWVRSRVQRYLDTGVDLDASAKLQVEVEVRPEGGAMQARATIRSPHGEHVRSFGDARCVVVADVAAFVVAQAIDPDVRADTAPLTEADVAEAERSRAQQGEDTPASVAPGDGQSGDDVSSAGSRSVPRDTAAAEAEGAADEAEPTEAEDDERNEVEDLPEPPSPPLRIGWAASLQAELAYGPLPELGPAGVLRLSLRVGRVVRVELGATYQLPQGRALPSDRSVQTRFDQLGGLLGVCATFGSPDSELGACLAALAAVQRGRGAELSAGRDDTAPYLALRAAPVLLQRIASDLWGRFELGPLLPILWPRFIVDQPGAPTVVHEPKGIGFFAALGGEWRFD